MACPPAAVTAGSAVASQKPLETEEQPCAGDAGLSGSAATTGPDLQGGPGPWHPEGAVQGSSSPGKLHQLADHPAGVGIVSIRPKADLSNYL